MTLGQNIEKRAIESLGEKREFETKKRLREERIWLFETEREGQRQIDQKQIDRKEIVWAGWAGLKK